MGSAAANNRELTAVVLALWTFRYLDPLTGKWVKARYRAELHEIQERYAGKWETVGPPEIREPDDGGGYFNPFRKPGEP